MVSARTRARLAAARALLDAPPPAALPGQAAIELPAQDRPPLTCDTGNPVCGAPARPYAAGPRCERHRPRTYRPQ